MRKIELLQRIKNGVLSKDPGAEIFLFGSRARGDNRDDSDWDIFILSTMYPISYDFENELRDPIFDIELETGQTISLMIYSKNQWEKNKLISPLFTNVSEEGIKI